MSQIAIIRKYEQPIVNEEIMNSPIEPDVHKVPLQDFKNTIETQGKKSGEFLTNIVK
tara:strand:+ start:250 stop:420 length:171 start_codon:yes stop_codon:yes gene_type:complete